MYIYLNNMENNKQMFVGEVLVSYKRKKKIEEVKVITSKVAEDFFRKLIGEDVIEHHEEFWLAYLNRNNCIVGYMRLSIGGLSATIVDIRHLMQSALGCNCSAMILMHNHPSGNLNPSSSDDELTKKIKDACDIFSINLLDHVILTVDSYFSYADNGKI